MFKKSIWKSDAIWGDSLKWKLDVIKYVITLTIATVVTSMLVNSCERKKNKKQFIWQSQYGYNLATLKEFERYSFTYIRVSYDAFGDLCWKDSSKNIYNWENEANDNFTYSVNELKNGFVITEESQELTKIIDTILIQKENLKYFFDSCRIMNNQRNDTRSDSANKAFWNIAVKPNLELKRAELKRVCGRASIVSKNLLSEAR